MRQSSSVLHISVNAFTTDATDCQKLPKFEFYCFFSYVIVQTGTLRGRYRVFFVTKLLMSNDHLYALSMTLNDENKYVIQCLFLVQGT